MALVHVSLLQMLFQLHAEAGFGGLLGTEGTPPEAAVASMPLSSVAHQHEEQISGAPAAAAAAEPVTPAGPQAATSTAAAAVPRSAPASAAQPHTDRGGAVLPAQAARLAELHGTVLASSSTICLEAELDVVVQLLTVPRAVVCNTPPEGASATQLLSSGWQAAAYACRVLQHTGELLGLTVEAAALCLYLCMYLCMRCCYALASRGKSMCLLLLTARQHWRHAFARSSDDLLLLLQVISCKRSVFHFWKPLLTVALFKSSHQCC